MVQPNMIPPASQSDTIPLASETDMVPSFSQSDSSSSTSQEKFDQHTPSANFDSPERQPDGAMADVGPQKLPGDVRSQESLVGVGAPDPQVDDRQDPSSDVLHDPPARDTKAEVVQSDAEDDKVSSPAVNRGGASLPPMQMGGGGFNGPAISGGGGQTTGQSNGGGQMARGGGGGMNPMMGGGMMDGGMMGGMDPMMMMMMMMGGPMGMRRQNKILKLRTRSKKQGEMDGGPDDYDMDDDDGRGKGGKKKSLRKRLFSRNKGQRKSAGKSIRRSSSVRKAFRRKTLHGRGNGACSKSLRRATWHGDRPPRPKSPPKFKNSQRRRGSLSFGSMRRNSRRFGLTRSASMSAMQERAKKLRASARQGMSPGRPASFHRPKATTMRGICNSAIMKREFVQPCAGQNSEFTER